MTQLTQEEINEFDLKGTNYLCQTTQNIMYARLNVAAWRKEDFISPKRKGILLEVYNKLDYSENVIKGFVHSHQLSDMHNLVLSDEVVTQVCGINAMVNSMPKGMRDQCEAYITSMYNVYRLNP